MWMRAGIFSPPPSAISLITPSSLPPFLLVLRRPGRFGRVLIFAFCVRSGRDQKMGADGLPVFNLYVRGSAKNVRVI